MTDDLPPLCVGCGMCCDGTLYGRARVTPGEEPVIEAAGLELVHDDEKIFFRLPCRFVSCGQCTNYENRYDVCRSFTCALYRKVEAGDASLADARQQVAKALELRQAIVDKFPDGGLHRIRQALREELAASLATLPLDQRAAVAKDLVNLIALDEYLERHFRNQKQTGQSAGTGEAESANS